MRWRSALAAAAVIATATVPASGQRPVSKTSEYSPYEKETIRRALDALDLELDPRPEGKIVRRIDTVRLEVLEERDPIPDEVLGIKARRLLNSLHYTTREYIVLREMLVREGDRYLQVIVDETARNMRGRMPMQVSIVLILPIATGEEAA